MVIPRYLADDTVFCGLPWIVYSALMIFFCFAVTLRPDDFTLIRIEGHHPLPLPILEIVQVLLKNSTVFSCRRLSRQLAGWWAKSLFVLSKVSQTTVRSIRHDQTFRLIVRLCMTRVTTLRLHMLRRKVVSKSSRKRLFVRLVSNKLKTYSYM